MLKRLLLLALFVSFSVTTVAEPLNIAVRSLDIKLFREVLSKKPDLNATDSAGMTALHHACALGAVEMTTALLENGADATICSNDGRNALHHAVNIAALCFNPQPQESGLTICPLTIPLLLASSGLEIDSLDSSGETPLHIAARNGLVGVIATLLQAGADPNRITSAGETPLHLVGGLMPHLAAQVLLVNGANPEIARHDGKRPIELASDAGNAMLVNMIKKYERPKTEK